MLLLWRAAGSALQCWGSFWRSCVRPVSVKRWQDAVGERSRAWWSVSAAAAAAAAVTGAATLDYQRTEVSTFRHCCGSLIQPPYVKSLSTLSFQLFHYYNCFIIFCTIATDCMCHHPFTLLPNSFIMCLLGVAELEAEILQPQRTELGRGTVTAAQTHPPVATRHGCRTVRLKMPRRQMKNPPWRVGTSPVSASCPACCPFLSTYLFISRTAEASAVWFCVFKWEVEGCRDAYVAIVSPHAHTTRQPVTSGACC